MLTPNPINPYEPPQTESSPPPDFDDEDVAELAELRKRVADLESRVGNSWLLHKNPLLRIVAVWGYLLLGYLILWAIVGAVALVVLIVAKLVTGQWL
jgi:hypothetical protein